MTKLANAHYWSSTQLRSTESSWSEMSENCSFWTQNITSRDPWWEFRQSDISHDRLLNTMTGCLLTGPRLIAWVVSCLDGDRNAPDCDPNAPDCDRNAQAIWWLYPAASFLFSWRFISPRSHHPLQHPIVRIDDRSCTPITVSSPQPPSFLQFTIQFSPVYKVKKKSIHFKHSSDF